MAGVRIASLLVVLDVALGGPARATMVERMSLDRVVREADRVVHATVAEVRSGRDESGLPATWITLAVVETFKGPPARDFTIKQYGVNEPLPDGTIARVAGLPRYAVGDELVLFLHGASRRGFTSPVGLAQGMYRIDRRSGRPGVRRGVPGPPQELDAFLAGVRRLAGSGR